MTVLAAACRVLWWFSVGWLSAGGFARILGGICRRASLREILAGEYAPIRLLLSYGRADDPTASPQRGQGKP